MKLTIYKGFDIDFLKTIKENKLIGNEIDKKLNVLMFDKKAKKQLEIQLINLEEDANVWMTYEEYSIINSRVEDAIQEDGLKVVILRNNIYPDYYPLPFEMSDELTKEVMQDLNGDSNGEVSEQCKRITDVYNAVINIDGKYYGSFIILNMTNT
jgi:ATP-dependent DNA helicase RecQ